MPTTDPIADLLARIRNAAHARHGTVLVPRSKIKLAIVRILKDEGFIEGFVDQVTRIRRASSSSSSTTRASRPSSKASSG